MTGLSFARALRGFSDVTVEKVEYLANLSPARKDGVLTIPTLVSGENRLRGIVLGTKKISQFLEALSPSAAST